MKKSEVGEGQVVRVMDGPLTGFRGEVKEVDELASTAKVAVQAFGRVALMDFKLEQIEQVKMKRHRLSGLLQ
jgi:transcription antitermination factor NusG